MPQGRGDIRRTSLETYSPIMWSKILKKPATPSTLARPTAPEKPVLPAPVRPSRVLQSARVPQQLSFEFRRG